MATNIAACLALASLLTACNRQAPPTALDHGWAPPGACVFVGNRADRHYCETTGTQVLANPQIYDRQLVRLSGWVVASPDGEQVGLFLTKDALETGALHGSLNLVGPGTATIAAFANKGAAPFTPAQARVTGRFLLHGLAPDGSRTQKSPRFGVLEEVDARP